MDDIEGGKMDDIIDNRLAAGPRECPMNCVDCLHWVEMDNHRPGRNIDDCTDYMGCDLDDDETKLFAADDGCDEWEEA